MHFHNPSSCTNGNKVTIPIVPIKEPVILRVAATVQGAREIRWEGYSGQNMVQVNYSWFWPISSKKWPKMVMKSQFLLNQSKNLWFYLLPALCREPERSDEMGTVANIWCRWIILDFDHFIPENVKKVMVPFVNQRTCNSMCLLLCRAQGRTVPVRETRWEGYSAHNMVRMK